MQIKKQFQGMGKNRYGREPLEARFAQAWQEQNDTLNGKSTLDHLMDENHRGTPDPPLSRREQMTANTVVQWLGSPVGQCFLAQVLSLPEAESFRDRLKRDTEERDELH